ncbi:hypothetical protein MRB53_004739 [Persea americana]|uniref:Uncharacterized protein n=1 Tax=Persea americana TaxID=3435 RepID=A0ACC2MBG8_PERAE|nr:hypothetical protein MRB53_004739 [Persea americana]
MAGAATAALFSSFSFLLKPSSQTPLFSYHPKLKNPTFAFSLSSSSSSKTPTPLKAKDKDNDIDTSFFEDLDPNEDIPWVPVPPPEGYVPPPYFDELPPESEEEIAAAYEAIYGPAYSGISVLGNDVNVMDANLKKAGGFGLTRKREKIRDGFEERVAEVRRVNKVVKGGKILRFRVIVVVGDKKGQVGVGVGKAREVLAAVEKSAINARRNIITVPLTKYGTFPHRSDGDYGAAKVMLRPASPGTGVIAGGSVKIVLEMAGVANALGKQLGSRNPLNNARAALAAIQQMRTFRQVSLERGIPMEELWK